MSDSVVTETTGQVEPTEQDVNQSEQTEPNSTEEQKQQTQENSPNYKGTKHKLKLYGKEQEVEWAIEICPC